MRQQAEFIFHGTPAELLTLITSDSRLSTLTDRFEDLYGHEPNPSETRAWSNSLSQLASLLISSHLASLHCFIEFAMPGGVHRCDVILLGQVVDQLRILIIELKQWSQVELLELTPGVVQAHGRRVQHPIDQVAYYRAALTHLHPHISEDVVTACVWLHNMSRHEALPLTRRKKAALHFKDISIYSKDDSEAFVDLIRQSVGTTTPVPTAIERFVQYRPSPSLKLVEACKWLAEDLMRADCTILGPTPATFTEEQIDLLSKFKGLVNSNTPAVLLVEGRSGSGKSLLAVIMMLYALSKQRRTALALINAHLIKVLTTQFRPFLPMIGDLIQNLGTQSPKRRKKFGLLARNSHHDVLICDEAQRISTDDIDALLDAKRSQLLVIFFDERQRLLPTEGGTKARFDIATNKINRLVVNGTLPATIRCRGGAPYVKWLDTFLYEKKDREPNAQRDLQWREKFDFQVFSDMSAMLAALNEKSSTDKNSVALVAAYTKSDGSSAEQRLRWSDPRIDWCMRDEYEGFWLRDESARLKSCASIYGCQGLEADYIGLLWGNDLAFRNGGWCIHPQHEITDSNGYLSLLKLLKDGRTEEVITLLKNRYFIFLTRGIRGIFVHCEDQATGAYLQSILET